MIFSAVSYSASTGIINARVDSVEAVVRIQGAEPAAPAAAVGVWPLRSRSRSGSEAGV